MAKSLQSDWQYLQRVLPDSGDAFAPLEEAIAKAFLPSLLQEQSKLPENFRSQLALPVRQAGIGIPSPCSTARGFTEASVNCTELFAQSLCHGADLDLQREPEGRSDTTKARTADAEETLAMLLAGATPAAQRQATRTNIYHSHARHSEWPSAAFRPSVDGSANQMDKLLQDLLGGACQAVQRWQAGPPLSQWCGSGMLPALRSSIDARRGLRRTTSVLWSGPAGVARNQKMEQ